MTTLSTPALNLRALLARLEGLERKVADQWHPIEPQHEVGDGTETDFALKAGLRPNAVWVADTPQVKGTDYTVEDNGQNLFIQFTSAPASLAKIMITREAQR